MILAIVAGLAVATFGTPAAPSPPGAPASMGPAAQGEGEPLGSLSPESIWASASACERALSARPRDGHDRGLRVRVGTWNLRWFPDGRAGSPSGEGTDVRWLGCVIASMDLDALFVQEVVQHPRGRRALLDLLAHLEDHTGHRWEAAFDTCPDDGRQHVGILWDSERVTMGDVRTVGSVNPTGSSCGHRLRPAIAARARFTAGLEAHLFGMHLDSGTTSRDHRNRRTSLRRLSDVVRGLGDGAHVIVGGDLNTMGCARCSPEVDAAAEIAALAPALRGAGLTHLPLTQPCSYYHRGRGVWLDHFAVSARLAQRVSGGRAEAHGPCGALGCARPAGSVGQAARDRLSDHCPLVLSLAVDASP